jgi:hypothetical protein
MTSLVAGACSTHFRNLDEEDVDVKEMGLMCGVERREFLGEISDCQFLIALARCTY